MRTRRFFALFALAALLLAAGCERSDVSPFTAELDEPGYRRGKELIRQGRNQEALSEFQKVIEKRGLNNAPESHLEVGLLYQQHIKDPVAAIYHYRKFREVKPNSPQSDLVRQRIDAATREFARTLPAQPLESQLDRLDMSDVVQRLQRENDILKADLASARAGRSRTDTAAAAATGGNAPAASSAAAARPPQAVAQDSSPVMRAPPETELPQTGPPQRPALTQTQPGRTATTQPTTRAATGPVRRHVIAKGDTLFSLAQRYYGNRSRWRDIYAANRDVMRAENDLRIGVELKIPQ